MHCNAGNHSRMGQHLCASKIGMCFDAVTLDSSQCNFLKLTLTNTLHAADAASKDVDDVSKNLSTTCSAMLDVWLAPCAFVCLTDLVTILKPQATTMAAIKAANQRIATENSGSFEVFIGIRVYTTGVALTQRADKIADAMEP